MKIIKKSVKVFKNNVENIYWNFKEYLGNFMYLVEYIFTKVRIRVCTEIIYYGNFSENIWRGF